MSHNNVRGFPVPPLPLLDLRCKSCVLYQSMGDCNHPLHYWAGEPSVMLSQGLLMLVMQNMALKPSPLLLLQ